MNAIQLGEEPTDIEAFIITLGKIDAMAAAPFLPTALQELVSSGQLSNLSSPDLRSLLTLFYQEFGNHESTMNLLLSLITNPQNQFHKIVVLDPYKDGKIISYDWTKIHQLRPELQNVQIGKKMIIYQMKDLLQKAKSVKSIIQKRLK